MAGRRFLVAAVVDALRLWHAGHSIRRLAKSGGMGRVRLREVIARVQEAGVVPGDRSRSAAEWEELVGGCSRSGWWRGQVERGSGSSRTTKRSWMAWRPTR